ncbi:MAG: hypothetical protein CW346_09575 [Bacillaceae bacterium]|nr:hypothetical protein [Bacillaceae bacterium]
MKGSFIYNSFQSGKSKPFFSPISLLIRFSYQSLRPETRRSPPGDPSEDRSGAFASALFPAGFGEIYENACKNRSKKFCRSRFSYFCRFLRNGGKKARVLFAGLSNFRIIIVRFSLF